MAILSDIQRLLWSFLHDSYGNYFCDFTLTLRIVDSLTFSETCLKQFEVGVNLWTEHWAKSVGRKLHDHEIETIPGANPS